MKNCKKMLSFIMAFIIMVGAISNVSLLNVFAAVTPITDIKLDIAHAREQLLYWKTGDDIDNFGASQIMWTDPVSGKSFPAYCVNPDKPGTDQFSGGYKVSVDKAMDNAKVYGAVNAGWPNNNYGLTDFEAYYATKMAVWCIVYDNYSTFSDWRVNPNYPNSPEVYSAFKKIYDVGMATNSIPSVTQGSEITVTASGTKAEIDNIDDTKYSTVYNVTGATGTYTVAFTPPTTGSMQVVDLQNNPKTTFNANEQFKVLFAPPTPPFDVTSNIIIKNSASSGASGNKIVEVLVGDPIGKSDAQSYALMRTIDVENNDGNATFAARLGNPPEETSTSLTIYKYSTETTQNGAKIPLKGVVFELIDSNGHSYGSKATDANGTVSWDKLPVGWYQARELTNNGLGYQLTPPTYQDITLSEANPKGELTFYDDTSTTVTPHKVDAVTGIPIKGVEFEIHQIDGNGNWKAVGETGADGTYSFKDVPDGVYSISEVSTVSGYILDRTPQTVVVKNGQATSVKFTNSKFPGLTITKVDKQTGATIIKPATFRVEQVDGTFSADVTTANGIATLKDIPVGTYKITEISAPQGYVLDPTCGTIYIGKDESKQYVATNTKKPVLTIEKIDGQTGKPISGVKLEIKKTDGTIIGTVTTGGSNGNVVVGLDNSPLGYLDPDVYTVTETFVPEPYVLPTDGSQIQSIRLNAGDTKTLTFMNLEMPIITVVKYDEKTGEKLPNAQFAIYEQADESRPVAEGLTDKDGRFTTGYVMPGTYVVRELNPPPGYMVSDKTKTERVIVAKAGDGEIIVKVDNIMLPKLIIKKIDAVTQKPLAGFTFKVTETDDTSVQPSTVTTDANGIIEIVGLKAGTYTVEEIACPSNYILDPTPQTVKMVGGDTKTLLFKNTMYPTLVVLKTDYETNKPVANTTFRIDYENPNGGIETVGTYKTNAEGRIVLPYVNVGWYSITVRP